MSEVITINVTPPPEISITLTPMPIIQMTMNDAGVAADRANVSATKARTWAEGDDADVAELGGEKSSKGWAMQAAQSGDGLWEYEMEETIKPILNKKVDASHISGTIDGGPLHP